MAFFLDFLDNFLFRLIALILIDCFMVILHKQIFVYLFDHILSRYLISRGNTILIVHFLHLFCFKLKFLLDPKIKLLICSFLIY